MEHTKHVSSDTVIETKQCERPAETTRSGPAVVPPSVLDCALGSMGDKQGHCCDATSTAGDDAKRHTDAKNGEAVPTPQPSPRMLPRVLVCFACHTDGDNVQFFLRHGLVADERVTFVFAINDPDLVLANVPKWPNVMVINRPNQGLDFGAWSHALRWLGPERLRDYTHFVFLNQTVRGPFLPPWTDQRWIDIFTRHITDTTKLVGPTINVFGGKPHVQSMLWATDQVGLEVACSTGVFDYPHPPSAADPSHNRPSMSLAAKTQLIKEREVAFSTELIRRGFNIACLLGAYRDVDFRRSANHWRALAANQAYKGDVWVGHGNYFGLNVHPYEVVFFKTNRGITPNVLQCYTVWHTSGLPGAPRLA